jgi:hypothetical protein
MSILFLVYLRQAIRNTGRSKTMAKQQVLHPSRRGTTLASLGFAALVAALLGMAWTISTRMYAPVTSPTTSVSAPVANEAPAGAPAASANRYFADEIAGANAQYADAAIMTDALPERLQDVRRPAVSVAAPAAPAAPAVPANRFFADEMLGNGEVLLQIDSGLPYVTPLSGPR